MRVSENYRPIFFNIIFQLLETVIYNRIYKTVENILSPNQHGFMKEKSTLANLTIFTDFVT